MLAMTLTTRPLFGSLCFTLYFLRYGLGCDEPEDLADAIAHTDDRVVKQI